MPPVRIEDLWRMGADGIKKLSGKQEVEKMIEK